MKRQVIFTQPQKKTIRYSEAEKVIRPLTPPQHDQESAVGAKPST